MTHDGSDGSSPSDRIKRQDYHFQNDGENVAEGYRTVDPLMRGWMNSPPHRENILGKFSEVGIAVARDDDGTPYWAVDFGTPWESLDSSQAAEDLVKAVNKERQRSAGLGKPLSRQPETANTAAGQIARQFGRRRFVRPQGQGRRRAHDPQAGRLPFPQARRISGGGPARSRRRPQDLDGQPRPQGPTARRLHRDRRRLCRREIRQAVLGPHPRPAPQRIDPGPRRPRGLPFRTRHPATTASASARRTVRGRSMASSKATTR